MGRERYVVRLEREERDQLERLIRGGKSPARKVARARILLKADTGWGVMRIVGGAGHVCGYGVPYQAAVPGGRTEAGLGGRSSARTSGPNWMSGGKRT